MIVYRVEYPVNRCGPYNWDTTTSMDEVGKQIMEEMANDHTNEATHPSIWLDRLDYQPGYVNSSDLYCAFDSFDKLLEWFDGYIDYLLNMGFQILEIEVPDNEVFASLTGQQTFFKRDNAKTLNILF